MYHPERTNAVFSRCIEISAFAELVQAVGHPEPTDRRINEYTTKDDLCCIARAVINHEKSEKYTPIIIPTHKQMGMANGRDT